MATLADLLRAGYTPPTESALADPIKEHFRTLPQKFVENQQHQMDLLAKAFPGDTYKSQMLEGDPKALAELSMQAPIVGLTAYHGTPHKILGKFDISKVGTGEGAQAYGHGMYFAENPEVAKAYRKQVLDANALNANSGKSYNTLQDFFDDVASNKGNLYKVDIPDEYIPNMLDWDKPLASQNKQVLDALKKLDDPYINKAITTQPKLSKNGEYWEYMGNTYGSKSEALEDATPHRIITGYTGLGKNPAEVSNALNSVGIKGVSYLDQGSRLENQGTRNFVVFDPSTVKILEENAKPVSRKELIEKQVNKLKD